MVGVGMMLVSVATAAELPIIAKARAFIGSEAALDGVKSVHYTGIVVAPDATDPTKQVRTPIEIIFQKPEQQRITATSDKEIETTALDGYEGWLKKQDPADPSKWRLMLLSAEQIKRLRANTWQNLHYFRGIERVGGRIEDQGTATVEGKTCQKVAFIHGPNAVFVRYFDVATGRLMQTETEAGGVIREEGEMIVDGIRFPRTLITTTKNAKGEAQTVTVNFEKIVVNQEFPASQFRVPAINAR